MSRSDERAAKRPASHTTNLPGARRPDEPVGCDLAGKHRQRRCPGITAVTGASPGIARLASCYRRGDMSKSPCPISRTAFVEKAEALKVVINGQEMLAEVKQFSTGSFGWNINAKTVITVDGKALSVQIGMNMTVVGSKDAER